MIVFESNTRGGSEHITITQEKIVWIQNEKEQTASITSAEWEKLVSAFQTIRYEEMNSYAAPTDKRSVDAAWHSTISVTKKNGTYSSSVFDDYNSPVELSPAMKHILKLKKKYF